MFGGGLGASAAGSTVVEKNLDRLTVIAALVFSFTTISLALLINTCEALSSLPHLVINDDQAHRLKMGNPILVRGRDAPVAESEAYATARGRLIAIGEIGQGEFRPKRVFG